MKRAKLAPDFAPETRFPVIPERVVPFRANLETAFEQVQRRHLHELLHRTVDSQLNLLYRHAANEAAALAASTGFPLLVWPVLFEEKAVAARNYAERQARIRERSADVPEEVLA